MAHPNRTVTAWRPGAWALRTAGVLCGLWLLPAQAQPASVATEPPLLQAGPEEARGEALTPGHAAGAAAQSPAVEQATAAPAPVQVSAPAKPQRMQVGDATQRLLALQASGQAASPHSYPVTSDVSQRTYQRYLEGFTHKIPEYSRSTLQGGKSGGGR